MVKNITIRNAMHRDIPAMISIEASAAEVFATLPLEFLQKLPEHIALHDEHFYQAMVSMGMSWIICVNEETVGFICTRKIAEENTLHIDEFGVALSSQGNGLGKKLLKFVIDTARQQSFSRLTLTTFKEVPWNAPFYEKHGFSVVDRADLSGRLRNILQEETCLGLPEDTRCAMELRLVDSSSTH